MTSSTLNSLILLTNTILTLIGVWYVRRTEKNTNSMKDALVASTATSSKAEGKAEGRVESDARAAKLAKDLLDRL